ncbi:hypothetical protein VNO77_02559 [Canavalia gladiata]|uniref:Uncharacterized protein n=1 Tax=Canavalia gladiata TaxID=3824 RepID=A0AAN9MY73_CANGL
MLWFRRLLPGTVRLNPPQIFSNVDIGAILRGSTVRELTKVPDRFHFVLPHCIMYQWETIALLMDFVRYYKEMMSWSYGLTEMKTFEGWYAKFHKAAGLHGFQRLCLVQGGSVSTLPRFCHSYSSYCSERSMVLVEEVKGKVLRLGAGVVVSGKEAATLADQVPGSSAPVPTRRGHANRFREIRGPWFGLDSTCLAQILQRSGKYVLEAS